MHVGVCRFTLLVAGSQSLKAKRSVLRKVKDRVRDKLGVTLAEVGGQDTWQRADLAFAVVAGERERAQQGCEIVVRQAAGVAGAEGGQIAAARIEVVPFGEDWYAEAAATGQAWEAKQDAGDDPDLSWVPPGWLEDDR